MSEKQIIFISLLLSIAVFIGSQYLLKSSDCPFLTVQAKPVE